MKRVKGILSLLVFGSVLLLMGCGYSISVQNVSTELNNECVYTLDEEQLTALELSGGVDVVVDSRIAKNQVRVLANTDDFSKLVVKAENGRLVISHKRNMGNKRFRLYIPSFDYRALAVSGGTDLEWYNCNVDELAVTVAGGADCEIKGRCNTLAVVVSGGADIDFDELLADDVSVVASGGADVELHAVKSITVTALSGSDISIVGNPQIRGWNVSGGADVSLDR